MSSFSAELQGTEQEARVLLKGELDHSAAPVASERISEALAVRPHRLTIELSELSFMDSSGIWLMVETQRRCLAEATELRLAGQRQPEVAQVLSLTGVETMVGDGDGGAVGVADQAPALRLYISRRSGAGQAIERSLRALASDLPAGSLELEVIDVFEDPRRTQEDRVIATPTLIRTRPLPELRAIGTIEDLDAVISHLGLDSLKQGAASG